MRSKAYGFTREALKVMHGYLTDRKQGTRTYNSFGDFIDLLIQVNYRSSSFSSRICYLSIFIEEENVTGYAHDTTPYSYGKNVSTVLENLVAKGKIFCNWFSINYLKLVRLSLTSL